MIADIFITTKQRPHLLRQSLESFKSTTNPKHYRLTIINDGYDAETLKVLNDISSELKIDHIITHRDNLGLGPSINQALAHISSLNAWAADKLAPDADNIAPFICYCQDDLLYTDGWLERLAKMFILFEKQYKLGFASGVECIEHVAKKDIGNGMILKDWIRAAQMFGRLEYWLSMYPITRFDPETGRIRAKPNDGVGSGVDWHFIRNHSNSICKTGRTCLVIPGLVKHMGYKESTWLKRELPESNSDKVVIDNHIHINK